MGQISSKIEQNVCTIEFYGDLAFDNNEQQLRKAYVDVANVTEFVLNFAQIEYIDSRGIGMLLEMRSNLGDNVAIKIINCRQQIKEMFSKLNLKDIFEII